MSRRINFLAKWRLPRSSVAEEALVAQILVQVLPVDAEGRERVLLALRGRGVAQGGIVGKALAGLPAVSRLHPNLRRRQPNLRNLHHRLLLVLEKFVPACSDNLLVLLNDRLGQLQLGRLQSAVFHQRHLRLHLEACLGTALHHMHVDRLMVVRVEHETESEKCE